MVYFQEQFHVNSRAITFLKQAIKMFILLNNKCLVLPRIKAAYEEPAPITFVGVGEHINFLSNN